MGYHRMLWEQIERILQSNPKLRWTNSSAIDAARGKREKILDQSRAALAKLKGVSAPQTAGLKRVCVYSMPLALKFSLLCFLIREEPEAEVAGYLLPFFDLRRRRDRQGKRMASVLQEAAGYLSRKR